MPGRPSPESKSWFTWTYSWMDSLIWQGYKKPLQQEDLYELAMQNQSQVLADQFEQKWQEIQKLTPGKDVSVYQVLYRMFGWKYASLAIFQIIQSAAGIASPVVLGLLTSYAVTANLPEGKPFWYAAVLSIVLLVLQMMVTLFQNRYFYYSMTIGLQVRSCLSAVLYRKVMRMDAISRQQYSSGQILNIVSSDLTRLEMTCSMGHFIWTSPAQIVVILALLISYIGPSALAGFALLLLLIPFQATIYIYLGKLRASYAVTTDSRIKMTQEFLAGMRIIKYFNWEKAFLQRLMDLRDIEVGRIRTVNIWTAVLLGIALSVPVLASVISFIVYGATHPSLNAPNIFAALALFNMMRFPLLILPQVARNFIEAKIAFQRLGGVLNSSELEQAPEHSTSGEYAIEIRDGNFRWEMYTKPEPKKEGKKTQAADNAVLAASQEIINPGNGVEMSTMKDADIVHLKHLNLKIKKGSLVIIAGQVGSGKSSLLSAILGEMKKLSGDVVINGNIGYSLQQPWIQNGSLKFNVVSFGDSAFNQEKFDQVMEDTTLSSDLQWLPAGADTLIGEKGVSVSGGQKARISLARVLYSQPDICLLDDPLSAVDVHVGRQLFYECIKKSLKGKTVILVTHHLTYLRDADYIIMMKDGSIQEEGTFDELMNKKGELSVLMREHVGRESQQEQTKATTKFVKPTGDASKGMLQEERATGGVSRKVYASYLSASGGWLTFSVAFVIAVIAQGTRVGNDLWLTYWTSDSLALSLGAYVGIYFAWGVTQGLFSSALGAYLSLNFASASKKYHRDALYGVFRSPMKFFDQTPLGRISNRFSKDTDTLDTQLPTSIQMLITVASGLIALLALMAYASPYILVAFVPLCLVYYVLQNLYLRTSREMKRLESIARSPIYSHFEESISGLSTVRAYRRVNSFVSEFQKIVNNNCQALFLQYMSQRWIGVRLEFLGALICFSAAILGAYGASQGTISAALFGVSLAYALQAVSSVGFVVRQLVEVEVNSNSIERLNYYMTGLDAEAPDFIDPQPEKSWPQHGKIEIKDLELKYSAEADLVLKGITFNINAGEKLGIVGRTGSGKSSLVSCLFRIVEAHKGSITIDGLDISKLGLQFRSRLAIIPQDPTLYSGTVRSNLDPFGESNDDEMWKVLESVNLKQAIARLELKLDSVVQSAGENFSSGQRQLLCLARAMLKQPKILILDEATAQVSMVEDTIIQESLRKKFQASTIIAVAHRLNTIVDYDRVLVLEKGIVAEHDTPYNLLQKPNGIFKQMVDETGPANAAFLFKIAKAKHDGKEVDVQDLVASTTPTQEVDKQL